MSRIARRRPSLGTVLGGLSLFVALGGPAQAAKLIDGAAIKRESITARAIKPRTLTGRLMRIASIGGDRLAENSISLSKLNPSAVTALQSTPASEVTSAKVADHSLGGVDLSDDSIGQQQIARDGVAGPELADDSVDTDEIADGRQTVGDLASFAGTMTVSLPHILAGACAAPIDRQARLLWNRAGATIEDDAVFVSAPEALPSTIVLTARPKGTDSIRVVACNLGASDFTGQDVTLRYLTIEF